MNIIDRYTSSNHQKIQRAIKNNKPQTLTDLIMLANSNGFKLEVVKKGEKFDTNTLDAFEVLGYK